MTVFTRAETDVIDIYIPTMESLIYSMQNMNWMTDRLRKDVSVRHAEATAGDTSVIF